MRTLTLAEFVAEMQTTLRATAVAESRVCRLWIFVDVVELGGYRNGRYAIDRRTGRVHAIKRYGVADRRTVYPITVAL